MENQTKSKDKDMQLLFLKTKSHFRNKKFYFLHKTKQEQEQQLSFGASCAGRSNFSKRLLFVGIQSALVLAVHSHDKY